jgi:two-component system response regulator DegU/two-component system secretion system response regulator SalR
LTPRQREVLQLLAQGRKQTEIAAELVIERKTVHAHLRDARERMECTTNVQLCAKAAKAGLL